MKTNKPAYRLATGFRRFIFRWGLPPVRHALLTPTLLTLLATLLASAPAVAQFAYVPNGVDRTVSVINTATNTVTATIPLNETLFPVGVAVNPSGTRVYVTNTCDEDLMFVTGCSLGDAGTVSVINTATNTVIATIPIPHEPVGIAVTQNESRVYVVNGCVDCLGTPSPGSVSVIDVAAGSPTENTVVATIPLPDIYSTGIAVSQGGSRLFIANLAASGIGPGSVSVVDTSTHSVATIDLNDSPVGLVLNPRRARLYAAGLSGTLSVIDTTNNTVLKTVDTAGLIGLAIKPDGTRLYALRTTGVAGIAVIDTTNDDLNVVATAPTAPLLPVGFTVHPDGSRVYVTNLQAGSSFDNKVLVIDTATNLVSSTVTVGQGPTAFGQFIAPGICTGANLWAYLASGPATPAAGGVYTWTVKIEVYACQAATSLKAQGGTNGWASPASVSLPSIGTTSTNSNNQNQVITWNIPSLNAGQAATLTLTVTGTIKAGTPSGTVLGLVGAWSMSYNTAVGKGSASVGSVAVTVE